MPSPPSAPKAPAPQVQLFGYEDSQPTRAAQRFFKERRVTVRFVDLKRRPIALGELKRFVERLGAPALLDRDGRAFRAAGLGYMRLDDGEIVQRLLTDPRLLRLPLVRFGNQLTAGPDEAVWARWLHTPE